VASPDLTSRPGRLSAVFGLPDDPPAVAGRPGEAAWAPGGVWPPPRPAERAAPPSDDTPTVPLLFAAAGVEVRGAPEVDRERWFPALLRRVVPQAWREARVHPGRPGATALVLVAAGAAVVAAIGVWTERPRAEPVSGLPAVATVVEPPAESAAPAAPPPTGAAPTAAASTGTASAPPAAPLVVSVSGKVHRPGLVEVPSGARVADVLDAAGGALPGTDLAALNLARRVADGEQVAVGVPPAPDAATTGGSVADPAGGASAPPGKVDLNTATAAELDVLPGVGPVTATRILEWRTRNGRFSRVEQLREIEGIGERRFAQLRELVTV
jgi:competence protein ComEA